MLNLLQLRSSSRVNLESETPAAMTEVDLLPRWYKEMVRRRRWLVAQMWATGLLVVVLTTILILRKEDVAATHVELAGLEEQRRDTDRTLAELAQQQARLNRLGKKAGLISQFGLPLEVSRVLAELSQRLPPEVALTDVDATIEDGSRRPGEAAGGKAMRFTIRGIAPEGFRAAERLGNNDLWRSARVLRAQPQTVHGRPVVAFEFTFAIDLTAADDALGEITGGSR